MVGNFHKTKRSFYFKKRSKYIRKSKTITKCKRKYVCNVEMAGEMDGCAQLLLFWHGVVVTSHHRQRCQKKVFISIISRN